MAIDATFKARLNQILADLQAISSLLVKTTPGQANLLEDILGTPAEEQGNVVLNNLQNCVLNQIPEVQTFKDFVDTL